MKKCSNCLLPETHETIAFDSKGTCNICTQYSVKEEKIDWGKKKEELHKLIYEHKGKYEYDCIIPFSGGKDSTWTLYYLIKEGFIQRTARGRLAQTKAIEYFNKN